MAGIYHYAFVMFRRRTPVDPVVTHDAEKHLRNERTKTRSHSTQLQ
jgi:hypothetical protein